LFYIYEVILEQTTQFKFIQLISVENGTKLRPLAEQNGPQAAHSILSLANTQVIVGDLDGNGYSFILFYC
jgi:hypothetical protein